MPGASDYGRRGYLVNLDHNINWRLGLSVQTLKCNGPKSQSDGSRQRYYVPNFHWSSPILPMCR